MGTPLAAGDQVPHFTAVDVTGRRVAYGELWQRKHLLLVCLPASGEADAYAAELAAHAGELTAHDTACVITRERLDGVPSPGVVVADRWGEIFFVGGGPSAAQPPASALVEWLRYVQMQCPECQGEAR